MSTLTTTPGVSDKVRAARQQVETTDFFALCYLMLCQLAYTNEGSGPGAVTQIRTLLSTMPLPSETVAGQWKLGWGPVVSGNNSNLMYAAEFLDSLDQTPVFSAIAIRGTDTQAKPSGVLTQLIEDLDDANQIVYPPGNQTGSKIAQGTHAGLKSLTDFQDPDTRQTVAEYVQGFVTRNPDAPVVVTGHSLGGCQTTVMALDLAIKFPQAKIVPNSFAAPTAGNPAFIQLYEKTFPFRPRWFNNIDLVPMAFAGLGGIKQIWNQCQRPTPGVVKILIDALELVLHVRHAHYSQQSPVDSRILAGVCQLTKPNAVSDKVLGKALEEIQALLRDAVKKLEDAVDKIPLIGGLAAHGLSFAITDNSFANIAAWVQELLFQHLIMTGYWNAVEKTPGVASIPIPKVFLQAAAAGGSG
jgi:hypothetical protein